LTGFGYEFGFFLILKNEVRADNGDINIHPKSVSEPASFILNYILSFLD
jgi:hypothetical protein